MDSLWPGALTPPPPCLPTHPPTHPPMHPRTHPVQASFPSAWHGYNVCASYDRQHWFRCGAGQRGLGGFSVPACCASLGYCAGPSCCSTALRSHHLPLTTTHPYRPLVSMEAKRHRVSSAHAQSHTTECPPVPPPRVPTEYDEAAGVLRWYHAPAHPAVYYAYFAPYSYERHQVRPLALPASCFPAIACIGNGVAFFGRASLVSAPRP